MNIEDKAEVLLPYLAQNVVSIKIEVHSAPGQPTIYRVRERHVCYQWRDMEVVGGMIMFCMGSFLDYRDVLHNPLTADELLYIWARFKELRPSFVQITHNQI